MTAADGSVSAIVPVNVLPGSYQLRASFAEDATALGSSTEAPLVVEIAPTTFESTTNIATVQYSDNVRLATLHTATGELLRWQPIMLSRTDLALGDVRRDVASFTDGVGDVRLDTMDFGGLAAGTYPIVAKFFGDVRFDAAMSGVFTVTVQKELATSDWDIYVQRVGDPPKLLGKSTNADSLRYVPSKSGPYWVTACKADYCFVIFTVSHSV